MRATARHEGFEAIQLDTFVDGAFAFTLTLLVTGGEDADSAGLWLSLLLAFFALIFLYPLHMMFASLSNAFSGGMLPSDFKLAGVGAVRTLFVIYGLVFTCMAGTRVLLFRHAAQRALKEGRAPWDAQREQLAWTVPTRVGLASALAAPARPANAPGLRRALPGLPYALMFLVGPLTARFRRRHAQA